MKSLKNLLKILLGLPAPPPARIAWRAGTPSGSSPQNGTMSRTPSAGPSSKAPQGQHLPQSQELVPGTWSCEPCLETCSQEPCLEPPCLQTHSWKPFLQPFSWKPVPGNLAWEPVPGNPCLTTVSGTLAWEPCLGTCSWEPGLGILPGNFACKPVPGKFNWKSCSRGGWRPQAYAVGEKRSQASSQEEAPKQVSRKRFQSKVKFLGTACKYGFQKRFPNKVPGTVSKQASKQEQGSQEQVPKQAFPGRAGSKAKFPGATGNPCLRTSSWEPWRSCSWEPCLGTFSWKHCLGTFSGNLTCEPVLGKLVCERVPCREPCLGTSSWEPCLGTCLGTLLANLFFGTLYGHLFLGTCGWEPCLGTSSWKHCLGTSLLGTLLGHLFLLFLETLVWKLVLGTLFCLEKHVPGNLASETCCGNLAWTRLPGNLFLETLAWKPVLGTLFCLGNGSWKPWKRFLKSVLAKPVPGNLAWESVPGNLFLGTLAWEPLPGNLA